MTSFEVYEPTGRILSAINSNDFQGCVDVAVEAGAKILLIDFKNILFMDSQGLGTLISARNRAETLGINVVLCSLNGQARMLLEMSGVDQIFSIFSDRADFQRHFMQSTCAA